MHTKLRYSIGALGVALSVALLLFAVPDAHASVGAIGLGLAPMMAAAGSMFGGVGWNLMRDRETKSGSGGLPDDSDPEKNVKEAAKELKRIGDEMKKFAEEAQKQLKDTGTLTTELKGKVDVMAVEQTAAQAKFEARLAELEQKGARRPGPADNERPKSAGQLLVESEEVKKFCQSKQRGSVRIEMKTIFSADLIEDIIVPNRLPGIDPRPRKELRVRDLISPGRTSAPVIQYVQQTGFTNNADFVSEGKRKPTSDIAFTLKMANVSTLAHIYKAAKQLLDDMPALQSIVDDELRYGLMEVEDTQILYGDGTGLNLLGIIPQATAYAAAFAVDMETPIDVLRLAMLQSQLALFPATGFVLHDTDWARIELTKDSQGRYILANPTGMIGPTLWGKPVVTSMSMVVGTFLTGAFKRGAQIFDREDANVQVATQNEDDFVKNMITLRAEERLALAVKRPEAFVTGDLT